MSKAKKKPTVTDMLRQMKAILRKGWAQGWFAVDEKGRRVEVESPKAIAFCLAGARYRAMGDLNASTECSLAAERLIASCVPHGEYVNYNDAPGRKKSEIIAVVDCAVKAAQEAAK